MYSLSLFFSLYQLCFCGSLRHSGISTNRSMNPEWLRASATARPVDMKTTDWNAHPVISDLVAKTFNQIPFHIFFSSTFFLSSHSLVHIAVMSNFKNWYAGGKVHTDLNAGGKVYIDLTLRLLMSYIYIYIYIYIYDISSLMVDDLTLILLTWRKWWANNASK